MEKRNLICNSARRARKVFMNEQDLIKFEFKKTGYRVGNTKLKVYTFLLHNKDENNLFNLPTSYVSEQLSITQPMVAKVLKALEKDFLIEKIRVGDFYKHKAAIYKVKDIREGSEEVTVTYDSLINDSKAEIFNYIDSLGTRQEIKELLKLWVNNLIVSGTIPYMTLGYFKDKLTEFNDMLSKRQWTEEDIIRRLNICCSNTLRGLVFKEDREELLHKEHKRTINSL